ncbi:MAG: hypothetical protein IPO13_07735 [Rhodocyclaceae bacterium]|nr:hypothetical protein [Rhodocyclaceae bacterium]
MINEQPAQGGGFSYYVSDEQLIEFAKLTLSERLSWVEAAREFTWLAQTPQTRERHERLRRGLKIV